jgi:hypothetical protein
LGALRGILRDRVAALYHAELHGPVEGGSIVRAFARELDEQARMVRRRIPQQVDDENPFARFDDRLLALELRDRKRRDEELTGRRRSLERREHQDGNRLRGHGRILSDPSDSTARGAAAN